MWRSINDSNKHEWIELIRTWTGVVNEELGTNVFIVIKDPLDHIVDVLNGVYCLGRIIRPANCRPENNRNLTRAHFVARFTLCDTMQKSEQKIDKGTVVD